MSSNLTEPTIHIDRLFSNNEYRRVAQWKEQWFMDIRRILESTSESEDGCWLWDKSCNSAGYGQLMESRQYWLAHRYAYQCTHGDLEEGDVVRHLCHEPRCCNPEHLAKGTHLDNWQDSEEKHRQSHKALRKTWIINGVNYPTVRAAAKELGMSQQTIIKHTKDGVFDVETYRKACYKARVVPRV